MNQNLKVPAIILITLAVNSILLPLYGATEISGDLFFDMMLMGLREMFVPTCYITAVFLLLNRLSGNWFRQSSWRIVLMILILIFIAILSQLAWSIMTAVDSTSHFTGFWGFYLLWTLLTCTLIPLLDKFFSKRKSS